MAKEPKSTPEMTVVDVASLLFLYDKAMQDVREAESALAEKKAAARTALEVLGNRVVPAAARIGERFTIVYEHPAFEEPQHLVISRSNTTGYDLAEWKANPTAGSTALR